jgi:predicted metalloprotease with PDZ domain
MLDVQIMKHANNQKGLSDVCRELYNEFGKKNKGYSEQDIITTCEKMVGVSLKDFFNQYVYGTEDFDIPLLECFNYLKIDFVKIPSTVLSESVYGFKTIDFGINRKVSLIAPYSPSWKAGLSLGDEIIAVNGFTLRNDFNDWMNYFKDSDIELTVSSNQQLKTLKLVKSSKPITYFDSLKLKQVDVKSDNFAKWIKLNS